MIFQTASSSYLKTIKYLIELFEKYEAYTKYGRIEKAGLIREVMEVVW